jgi:hypothetical protein
MEQDRLTNLAIMSIETAECQECDLADMAGTFFNAKKSRQNMV